MTLLIGIVVGVPIGWYIHKAYLRFLYKQLQRIKRAMCGGTPRRKRR
jgi:hypothetical protein